MATTCKLIAKNVLGSSASSVTFSDIPGTYTDLVVLFSARSTGTTAYVVDGYLRFNSDAGNNYSMRELVGTGSSVSSGSLSSISRIQFQVPSATSTSSTFGNGEIYIPNYAGSTNKSVSTSIVGENNATASQIRAQAGLWSNTAAITSITLSLASGDGDYAANSSFFLYGITKA